MFLASVVAAFLAMSVDDLAWLPLLLVAYGQQAWRVAVGYVFGTFVLLLVCAVVARIMLDSLEAYAGWLEHLRLVGIGFMAYGVLMAARCFTVGSKGGSSAAPPVQLLPVAAGFVAVLSNGWNNFLVMPVILVAQPQLGSGFVASVWLCNVVWAAAALQGVRLLRRRLEALPHRFGELVAASALFLIGGKIVAG